MKNKLKIVMISAVIVILTLAYSFIDKAVPLYNSETDTSEYKIMQLYDGDSLTQSFICKEDYLDGISVKISSIGDQAAVFLNYQLKKGDNVLVEGETSLKELESGKFFKIRFDRIEQCEGQELSFTMSVSNDSGDNGVNLYTTSKINSKFILSENEVETDETLVLRTLTHRFDFETFFVTVCFILYIVFFMKWMYKLFK